MWLLHQINVCNLARRTCCLKAPLVEGSIVAVCCHGHGEAHSLSVFTSLSSFRENAHRLSKNYVTLGISELKSHVMPVRTRAEGVCRSSKNICTVNGRMGST